MGTGQDHGRGPRSVARPGVQRLSPSRRVSVDAVRLSRWVEGFAARHGAVRAEATGDEVILIAGDGSRAVLTVPFPPLPRYTGEPETGEPETGEPEAGEVVRALVEHAQAPRTLLALLVRRGGYASAVLAGDQVVASAVGRRHVQGRTAAGGWSQQRFARRREQQADRLVDAAVEAAAGLLLPAAATADALVTGGDRPLVSRSLADRRLAGLARLARGPHLEVPDPRAAVVAELPRMVRLIPVRLEEAGSAE